MRFKNMVPYNMKKLIPMLGLAGATIFTACSKDDDPTQQQIDLKKKELAAAENAVRAAVVPAKTITKDISSYFNMQINQGEYIILKHPVYNIQDSATVFLYLVERSRIEYPGNSNEATLNILYDKSKIAIEKYAELQELEKQR